MRLTEGADAGWARAAGALSLDVSSLANVIGGLFFAASNVADFVMSSTSRHVAALETIARRMKK